MAGLPKLPKKFKLWRVVYDKGSLSSLGLDEIRTRLKENAFLSIDDDPYTFSSKGVVSIIDIDNSVEQDDVAFGSWVMFNWRTDERKADKKAVDRLLKKRIRKHLAENGVNFISRDTKNEMKEAIVSELRQKAEPTPSVTPIYVHPESDSIFYAVSSESKLEKLAEEIESILQTGRGQEYLEELDTDMAMDWLEWLWERSMNGSPLPAMFSPRTVGNEESKTTSDDVADLAFGKLNRKRCIAGMLQFPDEALVTVCLNPRQLSVELVLENNGKPETEELWAEELAGRLDMVVEKFNEVEKLAKERKSPQIDEACKSVAENVLS